jgi:integrase
LAQRRKVLDAIPWERRGPFVAASWNLLRPREVRALDLDDWDPERRALAVYKAFQGPQLDTKIGTTKNRSASWREVYDEERLKWLNWRMEQATAEARLRGEVALFWCPEARNVAKRWSEDPMAQAWRRACRDAGVPHIPLYQGTKHTTATALAEGGIGVYVLKALGGWKDARSAEKYLHVSPAREAIVQHLGTARHRAGTAAEKHARALNENEHLWRGGRDSNPQACSAPRPVSGY